VINSISRSECNIEVGVFKQVIYFVHQWMMEGEGYQSSVIVSGVHDLCLAFVSEVSAQVVNEL
jgi:hypothetical protein